MLIQSQVNKGSVCTGNGIQLGVHASLRSADNTTAGRRPPLFRLQAGRRTVYFQIGRVNHHRLWRGSFAGQTLHQPGEHARIALTFSTVVEGLWRAVSLDRNSFVLCQRRVL